MRLLISLVGPGGGVLLDEDRGSTRKALTAIPHDAVHLFAVDPDDEEIDTVRRLVEQAGASFQIDPVAGELMPAFRTLVDAIEHHASDGRDPEIHVQVNAGRHANLLSAAGLLACLHAGVPAHFVDEAGHTPLPVLTPAPLAEMLAGDEQEALSTFPDAGIQLTEVSGHDTAALNGLKDRGLIERADDRLVLTARGDAYRSHLDRSRGSDDRARG